MLKHHRFHALHYFSKHPSRALHELYWSVGLMGLGAAAVALFEPIYLYTIGYSLKSILLFYLLVYGAYLLLLPLVGPLVARLGYEHSILYSKFFLIGYYLCLFGIASAPGLFFIAPIVFAMQKSLYWPAYHADFALFSQSAQEGREVGLVETLGTIVYIVGPFLGGLLLGVAGFQVLFLVCSILFVLSSIPLLRVKEIYEPAHVTYRQVFSQLVDREHRRSFFAYLGFGEELIVLTVWPIFAYIIIGNFVELGTLISVATLVTAVIVLYFGKLSDKSNALRFLRRGSYYYFLSWVIRGFATNAWHVFGLDAGSRLSKEMVFVPLVAMTYGAAKRSGALRYAIFLEQSIAIAKSLGAGLSLVIVYVFVNPWVPLFILAAAFSLLYGLRRDGGIAVAK